MADYLARLCKLAAVSALILCGAAIAPTLALAIEGTGAAEVVGMLPAMPPTPTPGAQTQGEFAECSGACSPDPCLLDCPGGGTAQGNCQVGIAGCFCLASCPEPTPVIIPSISTNRGCAETGDEPIFSVGDDIAVVFGAFGTFFGKPIPNIQIRILDIQPGNVVSVFFEGSIASGQQLQLGGTVVPPTGSETLQIQASYDETTVASNCTFQVVNTPPTPSPTPEHDDYTVYFTAEDGHGTGTITIPVNIRPEILADEKKFDVPVEVGSGDSAADIAGRWAAELESRADVQGFVCETSTEPLEGNPAIECVFIRCEVYRIEAGLPGSVPPGTGVSLVDPPPTPTPTETPSYTDTPEPTATYTETPSITPTEAVTPTTTPFDPCSVVAPCEGSCERRCPDGSVRPGQCTITDNTCNCNVTCPRPTATPTLTHSPTGTRTPPTPTATPTYTGTLPTPTYTYTYTYSDTPTSTPTGTPQLILDFGDAPDQNAAIDLPDFPSPQYPTLLVSDGARHVVLDQFFLGDEIDREFDGISDEDAIGDDDTTLDDEDGISFLDELLPGGESEIVVVASAQGRLDAWIDFNRDGDWDDTDDQVFVSEELEPGENSLVFTVPLDADEGITFSRFRYSEEGGLAVTGVAADGEVEDYRVGIGTICPGDCNFDDRIGINELIIGVNIALDALPLDTCYVFDVNRDLRIAVNELVLAVNNTLANAC